MRILAVCAAAYGCFGLTPCRNSNENWSNFSLAEVLQNVEATIGDEVGVVGFRPWADVMKDPDALEHVQTIENKVSS